MTCVDNNDLESQENPHRLSFDFPILSSAFEIVSTRIWANMSKSIMRYNLTNIFKLLDSLTNKTFALNLTDHENYESQIGFEETSCESTLS